MSEEAGVAPRAVPAGLGFDRRRWLKFAAGSGIAALATGAGASAWLLGPPAETGGFADVRTALEWLDMLERDVGARSLTAWPLAHVLEHLAQSVEYSLDGFPELHGPLFRASVGPLAFRAFARLGRMRHDTLAPIPGAPPLSATDAVLATRRLAAALQRFEAMPEDHAFAPHFAYGALAKADYRRAHLMHLADHAREMAGG